MAIAQFKDLCIDSTDPEVSAAFWSAALGLQVQRRPDALWLAGDAPEQTVWINAVPEPTGVKNRVHLDVHCADLAELTALGATMLPEQPPDVGWTVMLDPDGQQFCAFVRDEPADYRLYELVVDAADADGIAQWWAGVFGVDVDAEDEDSDEDSGEPWSAVVAPGAPFDCIVFAAVPEPKAAKNRVHWDVVGSADELIAAGATLVRAPDDEIGWTVLADPEGNEFCAFAS